MSRTPRIYSCKFFLAGVNFYRFNAKNWQFTVYFDVITQKNGNFLCMSQLLLLGKFEYGGGPIFKVVLEC